MNAQPIRVALIMDHPAPQFACTLQFLAESPRSDLESTQFFIGGVNRSQLMRPGEEPVYR